MGETRGRRNEGDCEPPRQWDRERRPSPEPPPPAARPAGDRCAPITPFLSCLSFSSGTNRRLTYIELQCITVLGMEVGKDLVAASATPLVLAILAEGDSYGYAIIKRVAELSGGQLQWTDGMLYPVLHRLERLGLVNATWGESDSGRKRKYYRITSQGREQLVVERQRWQVVDDTLRGIWKR